MWALPSLYLIASLTGAPESVSARQSSAESIGSSLPSLALPASLAGTDIDRALKDRAWSRAEDLLVAEIDRQPNSPDLLKLLGRVFLIARKPLNAAIAIKKAEALGPIDETTRFTLVLAYVGMRRGDWARPELERLVQADSSNPLYHYWLGRLDYDGGQYALAIARFRQVIARDPGFIRAYDNLGLCYEALNQPQDAIEQYRRAIELNRNASQKSAWPALNLATLLRQRGELGEAEALLREALQYDASLAKARYQLGAVLEQQGRFEQATSELVRAATNDSTYAEPHYALARIYRHQGRDVEADEALATFRRLRDAERETRRE
jgi:tetratricopeptide (TPR) repeat protein